MSGGVARGGENFYTEKKLGEKNYDELCGDLGLPEEGSPSTTIRVLAIDRPAKVVRDEHGRVQTYSKLVLALGARALVPETIARKRKQRERVRLS
jgi:NADPH-dependent 2,4-dienoyl-CoA reductase/sulfur reductase-like enzyme